MYVCVYIHETLLHVQQILLNPQESQGQNYCVLCSTLLVQTATPTVQPQTSEIDQRGLGQVERPQRQKSEPLKNTQMV